MEQKNYPAHIRSETTPVIQTVEMHCKNTAEYTAQALRSIGLERTGFLLGMVHDCGKFTAKFADYIQRASRGEDMQKGSVNHTFAAVKLILTNFHEGGNEYRKLTSELIAYALGSHHGLFDCVSPERENGFTKRLKKEKELFLEARRNFEIRCCSTLDLERMFTEAYLEIEPILKHLVGISKRDESRGELSYYFGCLSRLLLSALIEGDRRDTTEFMLGEALPERAHMLPEQWTQYLSRVESGLAELSKENELQRVRSVLSDMCRDCAEWPGGIYRLNLPTGAGKTLSSLRFALAHAAEKKKERIIFISPLLSILEQNAAVIHKYLEDDGIILEHHSNVMHIESDQNLLSPNELMTESWDSPVIITTFVQLLNTLFSGKTSAIRRFHALCNSVIVVDEVQTLPAKLLTMFQLSISFLSEVCDATVVLCSATQPADEYTQHPFSKTPKQMIDYDPKLWKPFQRTKLQIAEPCSLSEISSIVAENLERYDSILIVCNKKDEAAFLFRLLDCPDYDCFHLSAAMCSAHRMATLEALQVSLCDNSRKTVCISTQVIEAGVDISFACVFRLMAGMDSVIQAAGRCNRNGESDTSAPVFILNCVDENLTHLFEIERAKNATATLLAEYRNNANAFCSDLASEQAIRYYYRCLYSNMSANSMDYPVKEYGTLYDLLANNTKYATEYSESYGQYFLCQSFKSAGMLFSVFDEQTETVLVPYGDGSEIIQRIREIGERTDAEALRELRILVKRSKPFSVSVFQYQIEKLKRMGAIDSTCHNGILFLQSDFLGDIHYSDDIGLTT